MQRAFIAAAVAAGVCAPAFADHIVRVSAQDLAVQTHKWDGKTIETVMYCFYADVNEYRCSTPDGARVDFSDLQPDAARASLEKNCDTVSKVLSPACRLRLRFVYEGFDVLELGSGATKPVVIADEGKGTIVGK